MAAYGPIPCDSGQIDDRISDVVIADGGFAVRQYLC